jgi:uncharacterized protein YwqG
MTRQEFHNKLTEHHLDVYKSQFDAIMSDSIRLTLISGDEQAPILGASRIGGTPDLPTGTEWPVSNEGKPLAFIAQLDLAAIKPYDTSGLLPAAGYLYFFYDADQQIWGFDPADKGNFKVCWFDVTSTKLVSTPFPTGLDAHARYTPASLSYSIHTSVPSLREHGFNFLNEQDAEVYWDLVQDAGYINKILGYADSIYGSMELECQLVTNGLYCGNDTGYKDPARVALEAGVRDWKLLLQVDSNEELTGMMWGDSGRLYFWIREQDLKERNFEGCWCVLQCF